MIELGPRATQFDNVYGPSRSTTVDTPRAPRPARRPSSFSDHKVRRAGFDPPASLKSDGSALAQDEQYIGEGLTKPFAAPDSWNGKGIDIGDEVAITANVRRRITEDRVSVSIPSYDESHSIVDRISKVKQGQEIELRGDVTRVDEGR